MPMCPLIKVEVGRRVTLEVLEKGRKGGGGGRVGWHKI